MKVQLKKITKIGAIVRAGYYLMKVAKNPQDTSSVLALSDRLLELGLFDVGVEHLKSNPVTAKVFANPFSIPHFDLDKMLTLPKNSLGHELASVMKANKLDPNFFRRKNPMVEGKVVLDHIEQTHDIWHIVLNIDTSVPGEVEILAFEFGQLRAPQTVALMSGAIMRCLFTDLRRLPPILDAIAQGWRRAHALPPLFAVHWNEIMHLPVDFIRSQLDQGIIPSPENFSHSSIGLKHSLRPRKDDLETHSTFLA